MRWGHEVTWNIERLWCVGVFNCVVVLSIERVYCVVWCVVLRCFYLRSGLFSQGLFPQSLLLGPPLELALLHEVPDGGGDDDDGIGGWVDG